MNKAETGSVETITWRRPTRRHRRNRLFRRAAFITVFTTFAFALSSIALRHLSPSLFRASDSASSRQALDASRNMLLLTEQESLRQLNSRPVYSYSVVPGGVRDASELKWVSQHDPVVAFHYAGFDYDHARVVHLILARTVYVSYRIGNKVYWTRHRVTLKKGETLITDGKITARSRCGNRVEETPQQATSSEEPPAVRFDQPMFPLTDTALGNPSLPFQSALLNHPSGPALPLSLYDPFGNGTWVPITPPPLPGVCGVGKNKTGANGAVQRVTGYPCATGGAGGGGEVPEPATWFLVASGLGAMFWKARQKPA